MVIFRPGVKPNNPNRSRLYFSAFRKAGAVPPVSVNYYSSVTNIGMLGNDEWGDCVEAANGHIVEQQTDYGQGIEFAVTTAEVLASYSTITGFNPNAGPPGDNPTDQGTEIQAGLNWLRKTGFGTHQIAAFAQLDTSKINDVKLAVAEFGVVDIGFAFPSSAMDQFNHGQPWDVVSGSPIEGGHCVTVVGYDSTYLYVFTWGAVQRMTYAFWEMYVHQNGGEAWAVVSQDWVNNATGRDPEGVDKYSLGAQYAALTGQANPFPAPTPSPTPTPAPPGLDKAEAVLVVAAHRYLDSLFPKKYLATALKNWLKDKGQ